MTPGRPKKTRLPGTGDKLRRALELFGLSWGKNIAAENHVLQSRRWARCRLPRSVNTIAEDLKRNVPEDRLAGYAAFLHLPINLLKDPDVTAGSDAFTQAVIRAREITKPLSLPLFTSFSQAFCKKFYHNNQPEYITTLFERIRGIYSVQSLLSTSHEIYNGGAIVHSMHETVIRATIFQVMYGTEIEFDAILFCWGSNIHISYYSMDMFIFGRLIASDPMRQCTLARRNPFSINLRGVSDTLAGAQSFGFVLARAELRDTAPQTELWEHWRRTCHAIRRQPLLLPKDAAYGRALTRLTASGATFPHLG